MKPLYTAKPSDLNPKMFEIFEDGKHICFCIEDDVKTTLRYCRSCKYQRERARIYHQYQRLQIKK